MKRKLMISYIFVVLLPVLIVGIILTISMKNIALNRTIDEASANVDTIKQRMDEVFKPTTKLSDKIYTESNLINILGKKYKSIFEILDAYNGYKEFDKYVNIY